jgi:hypothetical protein
MTVIRYTELKGEHIIIGKKLGSADKERKLQLGDLG